MPKSELEKLVAKKQKAADAARATEYAKKQTAERKAEIERQRMFDGVVADLRKVTPLKVNGLTADFEVGKFIFTLSLDYYYSDWKFSDESPEEGYVWGWFVSSRGKKEFLNHAYHEFGHKADPTKSWDKPTPSIAEAVASAVKTINERLDERPQW